MGYNNKHQQLISKELDIIETMLMGNDLDVDDYHQHLHNIFDLHKQSKQSKPDNTELIIILGNELKNIYNNAPRKRQQTVVMLFGVTHKKQLQQVGTKLVVEASGIPKGYITDIGKGMALEQYVDLIKQ